jgi:Domain of unknown function (DUF5916)/Carbohydrate family 9 binding domain-like
MTPSLPVVAVVLALQTSAPPLPSPAPANTAVAVRAAAPPVIDGRDGDAAWRLAPVINGFRKFQPVEDAEPSVTTEARVVYDERNLYVFVRAFDPRPDSIKKLLARRDTRICCDQIKVVIDSYHDRRTGFEFAVSPGGVKRDYAIYGDDAQEDEAWDGVWEVATQIDSLGWTAEFRFPLSQLRYAHRPSNVFGFAIWRDIDRHGGERDGWPLFRPSRRGFVSQLGDLVGLDGLPAPRRVEFAPYAVTKNVPEAGFQHDQKFDGGADIKYGITSNITVDATVNPDFGQVDADPSVVNLTSFETFFQERRPFFVEGTGIFNFPVDCSAVNCPPEGLFYSRRIGHDLSRILGAAKISGRLASGLTIGAVEGITKRAEVGGATVDPFTNYGVLRLSQDLRNGQSGFGVMATAVNRSVDQFTAGLRDRAYVGAVDFRHRFHGGTYEVNGALDYSTVGGDTAAISATQRNSTHLFQRPDDHIAFDGTRTSLGGTAQEILLTRRSGFIQGQISYLRRSPGFEINDLGFLFSANQQSWNNWVSLNWSQKTKLFTRAFWNFNWWQYWTTSDGLPTERAFNTNAHVQLLNQWFVHVGGTIGGLGGTYCANCSRGGPALRVDKYFAPWFGFGGDSRAVIIPNLFVQYVTKDGGRSSSLSYNPEIDLRVSSQFRGSVSANIERDILDRQDLPPKDSLGTHYLFAHLDQKTISTTFRIDYTATPTLTVQLYASPFVSKGHWSNLRELSATPRADAYDARYQPYAGSSPFFQDFNAKFFNSNLVVRWEYRPGSTLFLVWSQGRSDFEDVMGTRSIRGDFGRLFNAYPRNTFLIKASYWLSR